MKIVILTNGEYGDYQFCKSISKDAFIICVDGGTKHARKLSIIPNMIVGDLDSSSKEDIDYFKNQGVELVKLPTQKDETDTEMALLLAIEKNPDAIEIYGGIGSRFDHTLANVHLLKKVAKYKIPTVLMNQNHRIQIIDKYSKIEGQKGDLVSLLPLTEYVTGITTTGLYYGLKDASFEIGKPYGVSNYMTELVATVSIETGWLIVIQTKD